MLDTSTLPQLHEGKNLLAFSGGVDSSALFFLLLEQNIDFDIAIVDYQRRPQSKEEVAYAKELALKYAKRCHLSEVSLSERSFEAEARKVRYHFFETLIQEYHYDNLITAHQLDDRLEWLLMQLSKGAGLYELLGMQPLEVRDTYTLLRPLLLTPRSELLNYLNHKAIHYYEDESNQDLRHKRNLFRQQVAAPLMQYSVTGVRKSFDYLHDDLKELLDTTPTLHKVKALHYFLRPDSRRHAIIIIDKLLKSSGHLMRQGDREALKERDEHLVGRRYVVSFHERYCFIAPYREYVMEHAFKERCRVLGIPKKLRPYLATEPAAYAIVKELLTRSQDA